MDPLDAFEIACATGRDGAEWIRMRHRLWPRADAAELGAHAGHGHAAEVREFFAGARLDPAEVFIARDARGAAIGFAEASIRSHAAGCEPGRIAYLEGLYVEPSARRRGAGRALVSAVEEWARREGCSELASDADIDNSISHAMHRRLGFNEVERVVCFRKPLA